VKGLGVQWALMGLVNGLGVQWALMGQEEFLGFSLVTSFKNVSM